MRFLLFVLLSACLSPTLTAQLMRAPGRAAPAYTSENEEANTWKVNLPANWGVRLDTAAANVVNVQRFAEGYRVLLADGGVGYLSRDLKVRIPPIYEDIKMSQSDDGVADPRRWYGRRSSYGRYAELDDYGLPYTDFVFDLTDRTRIYDGAILEVPQPDRFYLRHPDGRPSTSRSYAAMETHPVLLANGYRVFNVQDYDLGDLALFDMSRDTTVTPFKYRQINRVSPVVGERTYIPLLEGWTDTGIELLRPSGKVLSDVQFTGVEDYNNWRELVTYFGRGDDPRAEAVAWTKEMDVYVVYDDDRVEYLGRYEAN